MKRIYFEVIIWIAILAFATIRCGDGIKGWNIYTGCSGQGDKTLDCGVLAYFPFSGNAESEGDEIIKGEISGTLPTKDRFGQDNGAFLFYQPDDLIEINHPTISTLLPKLTISAWIYIKSFPRIEKVIISKGIIPGSSTESSAENGGDASPIDYQFSISSKNKIRPYLHNGQELKWQDCSSEVKSHTWHLAVFTYDGIKVKCYLDGREDGGFEFTGDIRHSPESKISIGVSPTKENNFKGIIDDIRIYNRALIPDEIKALLRKGGHWLPSRYVTIRPKTFTMGSPADEPGRSENEIEHKVKLTYSYEILSTEIWQKEFQELMGYNPSQQKDDGDFRPVENLNWHESLAFCNALSKSKGYKECFLCQGSKQEVTCKLKPEYSRPQDCPGFRLPTEAEWEYAARAGSQEAFCSGDITQPHAGHLDPVLNEIGWYGENSSEKTMPIAQKKPNAWDLYDMSGNVREWVWDDWEGYKGDVTDPAGTDSSKPYYRVCRGGDYRSEAWLCRSAYRNRKPAEDRNHNIGFRPARTISNVFVPLKAGEFLFGAAEDDNTKNTMREAKSSKVSLTFDFEIQSTEVTQSQFKKLMSYNPSHFQTCGDDCPVENVNWYEALVYCNALSKSKGLDECFVCEGQGKSTKNCKLKSTYAKPQNCPGYRLPTEAEWEYAILANTLTPYYNGPLIDRDCNDPNLDEIGWYCGNSRVNYKPCYDNWAIFGLSCTGTNGVGLKKPNAWGLYDMSGNVFEWTWDRYEHYHSKDLSGLVDPVGAAEGDYRTFKGGCWRHTAHECRSSFRYHPYEGHAIFSPLKNEFRSYLLGFRPVRTIK